MARFSFELFLIEEDYPTALQADEFLDNVEEALFDAFHGDVTPAMLGGVPVLYCTVEGSSHGEAFDKVADKILELGLHPAQLLMKMNPSDRLTSA